MRKRLLICWIQNNHSSVFPLVHLTSLPFRLRKTKQCHDIEGVGEGKLGNQMCSIETLTCWKVSAAIHQRLYTTCVWVQRFSFTSQQHYIQPESKTTSFKIWSSCSLEMNYQIDVLIFYILDSSSAIKQQKQKSLVLNGVL